MTTEAEINEVLDRLAAGYGRGGYQQNARAEHNAE
jgi:hypothetical protein